MNHMHHKTSILLVLALVLLGPQQIWSQLAEDRTN